MPRSTRSLRRADVAAATALASASVAHRYVATMSTRCRLARGAAAREAKAVRTSTASGMATSTSRG